MNEKQESKLKEAIKIIERVRSENTKFTRSGKEVTQMCCDLIDAKMLIIEAICNFMEEQKMDKIRKVLINDEQLERAMKEGTKRAMKKILNEMPPAPCKELEDITATIITIAGAYIYSETSQLLGFKED